MRENRRMKKRVGISDKGITLIALVITIIVLLILAGVSIATLVGDNGIMNQANNAKIKTEHQNIYEALKLKELEYNMNSKGGTYSEGLIKHLLEEGCIYEKENIDGYIIDTEALTGEKQEYGNGTDGKTDVYKLEEVVTTGKIESVASTKPVKIAATNALSKNYKVVYYGKKESENVQLGLIEDDNPIVKKALITFKIYETEYQAEEGMTWEQWCNSTYNTIGCTVYSPTSAVFYPSQYVINTGTRGDWVQGNSIIIEGYTYEYQTAAECVYPNSNILISTDGKTALAKDIKESDEIVYFDFNENVMKTGKVSKVYIHKNATNFVRYKFSDGTYLEATDYHPIYTKEGWKSQTKRNGYELPKIGDEVKTPTEWKVITNIEEWQGLEDCYDFAITTEEGTTINNYYANGTLVQGSY